ncbi:ABC transporter substrate-binding protein [Paenibacillus paridis]|uniref:ABC transporter substrate-binding protein n=1 Tax=Paenibacillus paridis TaxID=2583376 RepID=UPI001121446A|nr:sugar ABC transporter substrate-binding protein [Paenibacillus paridis]
MKSLAFKQMIQMALVLVVAFTVSSCSNNNGSTSEQPSGQPSPSASELPAEEKEWDKTPITLRFAAWVPAENEGFTKIAREFEKKYPWVKVEWNFVEDNMMKAVTESIAGNNPIDVYWGATFYDYVTQNIAEDLTPYIDQDEEFKSYEFNPGILEPFQVDGKQYALSRGNDTFLVYYNKDLLKKNGLEAPANDWTWEDLKNMAKTATNPTEKEYGIANTVLWFQYGASTLPNANGHAPHNRMMNEDFTKNLADGSSQDVLDDLQWMLDWVSKDGIMLNTKRAAEAGVEGDTWMNGQSLFMLHVSPLIASYNDQLKFDWDVAPMPKGTAKQVGMSFVNPMMMTKASKHKEMAWEFMKFWAATVEGQKLVIDAGGTLLNTPNQELTDYFNQLPVYGKINKEALILASKIGEIDPAITMKGGEKVSEVINAWAGDKGYTEEISAYDYFPAAMQKVNEELGK